MRVWHCIVHGSMADDILWDMLRLDFGSWKDWNVMFNDAQSWTYILLVRCIFCITVRVKIGNCQPAEPVENCPMPKLGGRIWGLRDHSSENFSAKPDLWVSAPTVPWHAAKTWEWNRKSSDGSGFFHDFSMFGSYGVRVKVYSPDLKQIAAVIQMAQVEWLKPCNLWVSVVLQGHLIGCAQVAKEFLGSIADADFDDFVGNVDLKCERSGDPEIQMCHSMWTSQHRFKEAFQRKTPENHGWWNRSNCSQFFQDFLLRSLNPFDIRFTYEAKVNHLIANGFQDSCTGHQTLWT